MMQAAHTAVTAALLLIYWAKLKRNLNTCFSAAMCGASFYTAETNVKNPTDFLEHSWLLQSWPSYSDYSRGAKE